MVTPFKDGWEKTIDVIASYCPTWVRICVAAGKSFFYYHGMTRAASLTYTTFLAAIPFLILTTTILLHVGFGSLITDYWPYIDTVLNKVGVDLSSIFDKVKPILDNAEHIPVTQLGIIGVSGLFVTFLLAIGSLEINFNVVWENKTSRTLLHQTLVYSPILVVCAGFFGIFAGFAKQAHSIGERLLVHDLHFGQEFMDALQVVFWLSSISGVFYIVLFLMLFALPSRDAKYPRKKLILTSLLSALVAEIAVYIYAFIISQIQSTLFVRYSTLYGSLAFIPLLLLLVFGIWSIILCANSLTWAICEWPKSGRRPWNWSKASQNL